MIFNYKDISYMNRITRETQFQIVSSDQIFIDYNFSICFDSKQACTVLMHKTGSTTFCHESHGRISTACVRETLSSGHRKMLWTTLLLYPPCLLHFKCISDQVNLFVLIMRFNTILWHLNPSYENAKSRVITYAYRIVLFQLAWYRIF